MNKVLTSRSIMLALAILVSGTAYAGATDYVSKTEAKVIKDKVKVGLDMAAFAKLSVSEMFLTNGKWPNNNDEAKVAPVIDTDFSIKVGNNGIVTITYLVLDELAGKSIVLTPTQGDSGTVNWACKSADIAVEYLPKRCQ